MIYQQPPSPYRPTRQGSYYAPHDPVKPYLKPVLSLHSLEHEEPKPRRLVKPRPQLPEERKSESGVRRYFNDERPRTAMTDILAESKYLDPPVDKGRRLGRRQLSDLSARDPVKGVNCISTDMFLRPQKKQLMDHFKSQVDFSIKDAPAHSRKLAAMDPILYDRICETTRSVYTSNASIRQSFKQSYIHDTRGLLSWL